MFFLLISSFLILTYLNNSISDQVICFLLKNCKTHDRFFFALALRKLIVFAIVDPLHSMKGFLKITIFDPIHLQADPYHLIQTGFITYMKS